MLVGLNKLTRILSIDVENRVRRRRARRRERRAHARGRRAFGLHYAPDPSSQSACTIGGNVAENAGGPHCLKYGVTLNHVVALRVLLPSGEIVTLGSADGEREGYDLLGAFVGSEGCFGVALEVTVRLTPNPPAVRTLLADFTSIDDGARAVSAIIASGIVPAALEMMDGPTIRAVEASIYAAGYPADAAAVLLIEVDGLEAGLDADVRAVEKICRESRARGVRIASDDAERARLWQGRKKAFGAHGPHCERTAGAGRGDPAHAACPTCCAHQRDRGPASHHRVQRLPRRRRQPASERAVQWPRSRRAHACRRRCARSCRRA